MQNNLTEKFCAKYCKILHDFITSLPQDIIQKMLYEKMLFARFTLDQSDGDFTQSWSKILLSSLLVSSAVAFADIQKGDTLFQSKNENVIRSLQNKVTELQINSFPPNASSDSCIAIKLGQRNYKKGKIKPLIIINGKSASVRTYAKMPSNKIREIKFLRANDEGIEKYGKKAKNGVIVVTVKK